MQGILLVERKPPNWNVFESFSTLLHGSLACTKESIDRIQRSFTSSSPTCWSSPISRFMFPMLCLTERVKSWISIDLSLNKEDCLATAMSEGQASRSIFIHSLNVSCSSFMNVWARSFPIFFACFINNPRCSIADGAVWRRLSSGWRGWSRPFYWQRINLDRLQRSIHLLVYWRRISLLFEIHLYGPVRSTWWRRVGRRTTRDCLVFGRDSCRAFQRWLLLRLYFRASFDWMMVPNDDELLAAYTRSVLVHTLRITSIPIEEEQSDSTDAQIWKVFRSTLISRKKEVLKRTKQRWGSFCVW